MSITDDQLNNDIDLAQDLTNRTTTNIIVDSSNLANNDLLQYDSSSRQFEPRTPAEMNLYYPGGTDVPLTDGGTGASNASDARTNLGLGTIATQNSSNVTITGGSITGITDLAVADGGTGASTLTGVLIGNGTSAITAEAQLTVPKGGTGVASNTAYGVLCGGTTSTGAIQSVSPGTANYVLVSNGASALPSFQDVSASAGSLVKISSQTASSSSTIDFTGLSSTYDNYFVYVTDLVPSTDDVSLYMRVGTGGGPTYASTNEYDWVAIAAHTAGTEVVGGASSAAQIQVTPTGSATTNLGSNTGEALSGFFMIRNPAQATKYHTVDWQIGYFSSGAVPASGHGAGVFKSTTAVTAVRFLMSSGNIASGTFTLYGVKNA